MPKSQRRSPQEQIAILTDRIRKLKSQIHSRRSSGLKASSEGIQAVLECLTHAAKVNKTQVGEVITLVSRLKRTGLKIESRARPVKKRSDPVSTPVSA